MEPYFEGLIGFLGRGFRRCRGLHGRQAISPCHAGRASDRLHGCTATALAIDLAAPAGFRTTVVEPISPLGDLLGQVGNLEG